MVRVSPIALACALSLFGASAWAQDPKLNIDQQNKLRTGNLDKNSKDRVAVALLKDYESVAGKPDLIIPVAALKKSLGEIAVVLKACTTIITGFDEVKMPDTHSDAKLLRAWAEKTTAALDVMRKDYEARLPEAEKLSNPANYPDLEKDLAALEALKDDFEKGLRGKPEEVAERAAKFPEATKWRAAAFQRYKPFMIHNGGPKNPLYVKFQQVGEILKKLQTDATQFVADSEKDVPALLKAAEEMAAKAAAEKKPAFFNGGVKQKLDQALEKTALCEALLGKDNAKGASLRKQCDEAKGRIDVQMESLKEQILVDARAPKEEYSGADKEEMRKRIQEGWKKAYPQDELLEVRFPRPWDRKTEWRFVGDALQKSDMSYLYARAIVKTSDKIASVYVAVVNKDHMKGDFISLGVHTKKGAWVVDEVLLSNLAK